MGKTNPAAGASARAPAPRRFVFGPAAVDERTLELRVNGKPVSVDRKPLEVLIHLLGRPGEVVSKEELAESCWPGRILSDTVLAKTLSRLRDALGDREQKLIKTLHGQGYRLAVAVRVEAAAEEDGPYTPLAEAERRQLTVVFCDLVGSTSLSEQLDPEVFRDLILAYQRNATEVIERYEGHVAQVLGDGLLVYFGFPKAHDDDAERAVRCSYDLLAALKRLNDSRQFDATIAARIGIHTGTAVVGAMGASTSSGRQETLALGETTNLAARLQSIAEPNTVLMSDATRRLVPGLFITKDLGTPDLKGISRPIGIHQVVQPSGIRTRLQAAERLTPFVGRETEIALLNERWAQTGEGSGQAVLLSAEAGLGKSRLLLAMRERMSSEQHTWLETRASPMKRNSAYYPIVELLEGGLAIKEGDGSEAKLQRLEQSLDAIGADKREAVPLLAPLLNLTLPASYAPSQYSPELQRKKTVDLLTGWLITLARSQPLLVVFEDLHWADASTLELLARLLEQLPGSKVMVLMTSRPEFQPAWPVRPHIAILNLPPLRAEQTDRMVGSLSGEHRLPTIVLERIKQRAGGVPLFIEEITKQLFESGQLREEGGKLMLAGSLESLAIPATLQDSLMARLDRLGPAKDLAQVASVIGREIPYRLLLSVVELDESQLQRNLAKLTNAGLLYERGSLPDATYLFKHALIQDTAYNSLLKATRQKLHGKIAAALEADAVGGSQADAATLALHFELAGNLERAVHHYERAAEAALMRAVAMEGSRLAEYALSLVERLPDSATRSDTQARLILLQCICRLSALGPGHPAFAQSLARADALRAKVQDPILVGRTLAHLWQHRFVSGNPREALSHAEQLRALGKDKGIAVLEGMGGSGCGWIRWQLGEPTIALSDLESAIRVFDDTSSRQAMMMFGYDGITSCLTMMSWAAWLAGFPQRGKQFLSAALARAELSGHHYSTGLVKAFSETLLPLLMREPAGVAQGCADFEASAQRYGFDEWVSLARLHRGLALSMEGNPDEGLPLVHAAITDEEARGSVVILSAYCGLEAEQCLAAGRLEDAANNLERARTFMNRYGTRLWEAELHRLHGELVLARSRAKSSISKTDLAEIESSFARALEVSRRQGAKALELRAAISLARLCKDHPRIADARNVLERVCSEMTERIETPDLAEARALLA